MNKEEITVASCLKKIADMESDIITTIDVFAGVMQAIGVKSDMFQEGKEIGAILPPILGNLTRKMAMGTFDDRAFHNISAIIPVFEKYKHLVDENTLKNEHK